MPIASRTLAILLASAVVATTGCATSGGASRTDSGTYGNMYGPNPEPDPARKISEQDCRMPIVLDGGNLRCK